MKTSLAVKRAQREILDYLKAETIFNPRMPILLEDTRKLRQILKELEEEAYEWGVEQTKSCIGDWHKPN